MTIVLDPAVTFALSCCCCLACESCWQRCQNDLATLAWLMCLCLQLLLSDRLLIPNFD